MLERLAWQTTAGGGFTAVLTVGAVAKMTTAVR